MTNLNTLNDEIEPADSSAEGVRLEISPTPALKELLAGFTALREAIMHNAPVKKIDVEALGESLDALAFRFDNQMYTKDEMEKTTQAQMDKYRRTYALTNLIDFSKILFINDQIARELSEYEDLVMNLKNLHKITDTQAALLSKWNKHEQFSTLSLDGLRSLTDDQASSFSKFNGMTLTFDGLKNLSDNQALALGKFKGRILLSFKNLKSITETQALSLAKYTGKTLDLRGVTTIDEAQAAGLAQSKSQILILAGLTILTDDQTLQLSTFKGACLDLSGIKSISEEALQMLANIKRRTNLNLKPEFLERIMEIYQSFEKQ